MDWICAAAPGIQYLYFLHTLRSTGHLGNDPEYFVAIAQRKRNAHGYWRTNRLHRYSLE